MSVSRAILLGVWVGLSCGAARGESAKLTMTKLSPGCAVRVAGGETMAAVVGVSKQNSVELSAGGSSKELTIGDSHVTVNFVPAGRRFTVKSDGGTQVLRPMGSGFDAAEVKLGEQKYLLGFPAVMMMNSSFHLAYRSGAAQQATIDGQPVAFYDGDTDGRYVAGKDGVRTSRGDEGVMLFAPIGKHFATKAGVYEIKNLNPDGSALEYAAVDAKETKLAVSFGGNGLVAEAVFASDEGGLNLVAGSDAKGGMAVLPGSYTMMQGIVCSPGLKRAVATILPSREKVEVAAGQTAKVELGGPYKLSFVAEKKGDKLAINPGRFQVTGKNGEQYVNLSWKRTSPPGISLVVDKKTMKIGNLGFG